MVDYISGEGIDLRTGASYHAAAAEIGELVHGVRVPRSLPNDLLGKARNGLGSSLHDGQGREILGYEAQDLS